MIRSIVDLSRKLAAGRLSAAALTEAALAHPGLEPRADAARAEAALADQAAAAGLVMPRLAGVPLALGPALRLATGPVGPARTEAGSVARLRRAGAVIVGQVPAAPAASALGLETGLANPAAPECVPGGAASGAACAVATGAVAGALCADALGGVRLPAALAGLVGFRPTPGRWPLDGVSPQVQGFDGLGLIAHSTSCCAVLDDVLTGGAGQDVDSRPEGGLRLAVLEAPAVADPDEAVAAALQGALTRLSSRGVRLSPLAMPELAELDQALPMIAAGIAAAGGSEPLAAAAEALSAVELLRLQSRRITLQATVLNKFSVFDAVLLPTVPITAPPASGLASPTALAAVEARARRNAWLAGWLGLPALSIPCQMPGELPVGLTLFGLPGQERALLALGRGVETIIRGQGFAPAAPTARGGLR